MLRARQEWMHTAAIRWPVSQHPLTVWGGATLTGSPSYHKGLIEHRWHLKRFLKDRADALWVKQMGVFLYPTLSGLCCFA